MSHQSLHSIMKKKATSPLSSAQPILDHNNKQKSETNNNNNKIASSGSSSSSSSSTDKPSSSSLKSTQQKQQIYPPQQYALELDQLHARLLDKFTKAQEYQEKKVRKLKSELEEFRIEIQNLAVENYATSVVWSNLVDERVRVVQREQRERQKIYEALQTARRREIELQRRKAAEIQHRKDEEDFGTSSYYEKTLLRVQLRESERRGQLEKECFDLQLELAQNFARGYDVVWRHFAAKMNKDMKLLEQLLV